MKSHFALFVALVWSGAACAACPAAPNPANGYTIAATHTKLKKQYPEVQLPQVPAANIRQWCNQGYKQVGELWLAMDIYARAKVTASAPAIVLVHGGGWRAGSRDLYGTLAGRLAEKGYVAATVSYRLAGQAKYPAAVHDIRDAVRWLRANSSKYGIIPSALVIAGGSAGGQMASLVGLTTGNVLLDKYASETPELARVSAIVNIDGLSSFTVPLALKYENDPRKKPSSAEAWFGGRYEDLPQLWQEASPLTYASHSSPPILFINSGRERFSAGQAEMLTRLKRYTVESLPSSPHSFWLFEPWQTLTVGYIDRFLQQTLKL